jgi:hypothetical protein
MIMRIAALEAYDVWAAATSSIAERMEGVPDLSAFRSVIRAKSTTPQVAGCLRACAEGGWSEQESLFLAGRATTPACQACETGKAGCLYHKLRECPHTEPLRKLRLGAVAGINTRDASLKEKAEDPLLRLGIPERTGRAPHRRLRRTL